MKCFRIVLASVIPYFHAMFTNDMVESKMNEITLDEHGGTIDPGSFEMIINFAYSGKVTISTANVQSLMTAASFLMVTRVRDACAEFLMARLTAFNVLGIRQFAESQGSSLLVNACEKYVRKYFTDVSETEEFLNLEIEDISDIINEDELYVTSEQQVFKAVASWVKHKREARQDHLPYLLAKVRLPLLTPQFLSDTVAADELIRSSHRCRYLLRRYLLRQIFFGLTINFYLI